MVQTDVYFPRPAVRCHRRAIARGYSGCKLEQYFFYNYFECVLVYLCSVSLSCAEQVLGVLAGSVCNLVCIFLVARVQCFDVAGLWSGGRWLAIGCHVSWTDCPKPEPTSFEVGWVVPPLRGVHGLNMHFLFSELGWCLEFEMTQVVLTGFFFCTGVWWCAV
jgi:hypothetical protein